MTAQRGFVGRLTDSVEALAYSSPIYSLSLKGKAPLTLSVEPNDPWRGESDYGREITAGIWRFGPELAESPTPDWLNTERSATWRDRLHGFGWLRDLRAAGGDNARRVARRHMDDWIARFDRWDSEAWAPHRIAVRLPNWLMLHRFTCESADEDFRSRVFQSMTAQGKHLARLGVSKLDAEDRITAAKSLIFLGFCLPGFEQKLKPALESLRVELERQILPDGGHVSRSPAVLLRVLTDLVELRGLFGQSRHPLPAWIQHSIDRMTPCLRFFLHGDGQLSHFHGAACGNRMGIDRVMDLADMRGRPLKTLTQSRFERVLANRSLLLVDSGATGRHEAPFSFEFSTGKHRLISNCGGLTGFGDLGDALERPAGHTGLHLADGDCGYDADAGAHRQSVDGATLIEMSTGAFGSQWTRRLYLTSDGADLRGEEMVTPCSRSRDLVLRLHLHPDVSASLMQGGNGAWLKVTKRIAWGFRIGAGELTLEPSIYVSSCGEMRGCQQLVIRKTLPADAEARLTWALRREHA
ncbi:MAG: heparinase II/III family protein [Alphaproteobacteria bacterium]